MCQSCLEIDRQIEEHRKRLKAATDHAEVERIYRIDRSALRPTGAQASLLFIVLFSVFPRSDDRNNKSKYPNKPRYKDKESNPRVPHNISLPPIDYGAMTLALRQGPAPRCVSQDALHDHQPTGST
jgi:hypothetical protein